MDQAVVAERAQRARLASRATRSYPASSDARDARSSVVTDPRLIRQAAGANGLSKRLFDVVAALAGLIILAPFMVTIAILVRLQDGGPAIFGHSRIGRLGVPFKCLKFRSMVTNAAAVLEQHLASNPEAAKEWAENHKLTNDPRITKLGQFLRKSSLDELPQLWNVLVGQMSVVGPRPIVRSELDRYGSDRRYYLLVRPGVTGLWQVSGRSDTTYERRIQLDRMYLLSWSFFGDIMLILRTIPAVLKFDGAR